MVTFKITTVMAPFSGRPVRVELSRRGKRFWFRNVEDNDDVLIAQHDARQEAAKLGATHVSINCTLPEPVGVQVVTPPTTTQENTPYCGTETGRLYSLQDAIQHAKDKSDNTPCGREHAQLAKWLEELDASRKASATATLDDLSWEKGVVADFLGNHWRTFLDFCREFEVTEGMADAVLHRLEKEAGRS